MQLKNKKKLPLVVSAAVTAIVSIGQASGEDSVELTNQYYFESDDRISVNYTAIDIKKDFGTDWSLSASFSVDEITGGSPIWDSVSSPSPCMDEGGNYICGDPENRPGNLIGGPQTDMSDFVFRNVELVDQRNAANLSLVHRTESRDELTFGLAYSEEIDFESQEASFGYLHYLDASKNNSLSFGASIQKNKELFYFDEAWFDIDVMSAEVSYTQIFNSKTLAKLTLFGAKETGALTNPYQTVIRRVNILDDDASLDPIYRYFRAREIRPDEKNLFGIALTGVSELEDGLKVHAHYRYYKDDWDILSHTVDLKAYYNLTEKIVLAPNVRYYKQSQANFFKDRRDVDFIFDGRGGPASTDDRLGDFYTITYALGIESKLTDKWDIHLHGAAQRASYGLGAHWVSGGVRYAF